jgi:DNA-binding GntR family transcriptional regulator
MAFEQLKHLGVLEQRPRSGTYLRTLTMAEFVEITQFRAVLEGFVCGLACDKLAEAELAQLEELAAELDRDDPDDPERDQDAVLAADLTFHSQIAHASGNRTLISILDTQRFISHHLEILPEMHLDRSVPVRIRHIDIVRALRARDAGKAEQLMREHILWHSARKRRRERSR